MELEEMKKHWLVMSAKMDKQKQLTDKLIMDMTKERYTKNFKTLATYESVGALVGMAMSLFVLFNFDKLDTWYQVGGGVLLMTYLTVIPLLALWAVQQIKRVNISDNNYKETLISFAKAKKNLLLVQKAAIYLSFIPLIFSLLIAAKIRDNKDIFTSGDNKLWLIPLLVLVLLVIAKSGFNWYKGITNSAENILKELERQ